MLSLKRGGESEGSARICDRRLPNLSAYRTSNDSKGNEIK